MKIVKQSFKSVSLATLIFCAAATTAFAGQRSVSANTNRGAGNFRSIGYSNSQQVQTNHQGTSGRTQVGYSGGVRRTNAHQVQTSNNSTTGRQQGAYTGAQVRSHRQIHGNR